MEQVANQIRSLVDHWKHRLARVNGTQARHKQTLDRWSIAEVVGHLVDSANNNYQRIVRGQTDDRDLRFVNYDQNHWVKVGDYNAFEWRSLVELWTLANEQIAHVIARFPETHLSTLCVLSDCEPCDMRFIIDDYLSHLEHHLRKLEARLF